MATESAQMQIRGATPEDRDVLFDVWLRSVQATHTFVSAADIESFMPLVRTYLGSTETEFWVLCDAEGAVMGFMGLAGHAVESLFLAPEFHRRGGGRRLIEQARASRGALTVDVNEQNTAAVGSIRPAASSLTADPSWTTTGGPIRCSTCGSRHRQALAVDPDVTQTCWEQRTPIARKPLQTSSDRSR